MCTTSECVWSKEYCEGCDVCKTSECVWSKEYCEGCDVCVRQVSVCVE